MNGGTQPPGGSPTGVPTSGSDSLPPPVGLAWSKVAEATGLDLTLLQREGAIVLAGDYVPAPGFVIDPSTFLARPARIGDRVLYHSYFLGELTANQYGLKLALAADDGAVPNAVVRRVGPPIIALFAEEQDAEHARRRILEGSVGAALSLERGPLGIELRVDRTALPGLVATLLTGSGGAVIAVGGRPLLA